MTTPIEIISILRCSISISFSLQSRSCRKVPIGERAKLLGSKMRTKLRNGSGREPDGWTLKYSSVALEMGCTTFGFDTIGVCGRKDRISYTFGRDNGACGHGLGMDSLSVGRGNSDRALQFERRDDIASKPFSSSFDGLGIGERSVHEPARWKCFLVSRIQSVSHYPCTDSRVVPNQIWLPSLRIAFIVVTNSHPSSSNCSVHIPLL